MQIFRVQEPQQSFLLLVAFSGKICYAIFEKASEILGCLKTETSLTEVREVKSDGANPKFSRAWVDLSLTERKIFSIFAGVTSSDVTANLSRALV